MKYLINLIMAIGVYFSFCIIKAVYFTDVILTGFKLYLSFSITAVVFTYLFGSVFYWIKHHAKKQ